MTLRDAGNFSLFRIRSESDAPKRVAERVKDKNVGPPVTLLVYEGPIPCCDHSQESLVESQLDLNHKPQAL